MSRTNPNKKKKRRAKKTILIFGEGFNEEMFLKHLRKLYAYDSGIAVTVKKGRGGNAQNIVVDSDKIPGAFGKKVVMFDNDKPKNEMIQARKEAKVRNILLLENTPCLEYLLMTIVDKKPKKKNSQWCKKEFENKYIHRKKRREFTEYDKVFPKKLLDYKRSTVPILNKLISMMQGG